MSTHVVLVCFSPPKKYFPSRPQRIIANTIRQVRHCRSQPFSKSDTFQSNLGDFHWFQTNSLFIFFYSISLYSLFSLSTPDPDICQPNKNQAEVRGYVRKLCVIDNQRALTQLSYRLEPRRTWAALPILTAIAFSLTIALKTVHTKRAHTFIHTPENTPMCWTLMGWGSVTVPLQASSSSCAQTVELLSRCRVSEGFSCASCYRLGAS